MGNLRNMASLVALVAAVAAGCASAPGEPGPDPEPKGSLFYRQRMRELVISLCRYARTLDPEFIVIPQNGNELLTVSGGITDAPALDYIRAIDGVGREDLFYGYRADDRQTPPEAIRYMLPYLEMALEHELAVLVIDYCRQRSKVDDSYSRNSRQGSASFAAPRRDLTTIPGFPDPLFAENGRDVRRLADARNFLILINPGAFASKERFVSALGATNYDLLIIDAFVDGPEGLQWLKPEDVESLKTKANGARRLVISYLSIGEAEAYRYYWDSSWDRNRDGLPDAGAPDWLTQENPDWEGNYKVRYWHAEWQAILFGAPESYLDQIVSRGFDGVYLDIVDAFEYFESRP
jgi:cysteinyl-tRNA synthetase